MTTYDAYSLIIKIEKDVDVNSLVYNNKKMWPLMKQILWNELTSIKTKDKKNYFKQRLKNMLLSILNLFTTNNNHYCDTLFISRPVYLQKLLSSQYFDRIVDPIIFSSKNKKKIKKYYLTNKKIKKKLYYSADLLRESRFVKNIHISESQQKIVLQIAKISGIDNLLVLYLNNISIFISWFNKAKKHILDGNIRNIYLVGWYFPDVMGICAAAHDLNIKTIDVQHGKQGKYQAMYSSWSVIPNYGYELMPSYFWCWGEDSYNNILNYRKNRKIHTPFIGGYPWIDYYNKYIQTKKNISNTFKANKIVLFTMQPPQGSNIERIPDFIIEYLQGIKTESILFIFRLHPNDTQGNNYCLEKLKSINTNLFFIDNQEYNLYDRLEIATHHITAYSSCCYEALYFKVPTLLFGNESKYIYDDEISKSVFDWSIGTVRDLSNWLVLSHKIEQGNYIISSLNYTSKIVNKFNKQ